MFETDALVRANVWLLSIAIAIFTLATIVRANPFDPRLHRWEITLAIALAGLIVFAIALRSMRARDPEERFAAVGLLGGAVIALAFVAAELLVGAPQRVDAAPGQWYRPPHSARLALEFPPVSTQALGRADVDAVGVVLGDRRMTLNAGMQARVGSYMFSAKLWPAAYVEAWSQKHVAQTVTQPNGISFVSPVLQFPDVDRDGLAVDGFAVPALHREVRVKYYPGLPERGIDIPFLTLEIDEENGGALYSGVAISGRPLRKAGVDLVFTLGTYPAVSMAPVPDTFMYAVGTGMIAVGVLGFALALVWARKPRA